MLTEEAIRQALHACRVVPLAVTNPNGPLGLEHLAAVVATLRDAAVPGRRPGRVRRPIELPVETWEKLHALAAATSRTTPSPVSASEVAAAIIEQYVVDAPH
jgi:hypothetical protein